MSRIVSAKFLNYAAINKKSRSLLPQFCTLQARAISGLLEICDPDVARVLKQATRRFQSRLIVEGEMQYRSYRKDGEQSDRREAEVEIANGGMLNFIDSEKAD